MTPAILINRQSRQHSPWYTWGNKKCWKTMRRDNLVCIILVYCQLKDKKINTFVTKEFFIHLKSLKIQILINSKLQHLNYWKYIFWIYAYIYEMQTQLLKIQVQLKAESLEQAGKKVVRYIKWDTFWYLFPLLFEPSHATCYIYGPILARRFF